MDTAAAVLVAAGAVALLSGRLHALLHLFQLEHYEPARLREWVTRRGERVIGGDLALLTVAGGLVALVMTVASPAVAFGASVAAGAALLSRAAGVWRRPQVKALVFTKRAKRLFGVALASGAVVIAALALVAGPAWVAVLGVVVDAALAHLLGPELLFAANAALKPVQSAENRRYRRRAEQRLAEVDPLVVGITGSYGKTTTKACIARVAELRGPAYPTPASFNSYLGVIRAVNEGLTPRHKTFIAEMGAYRAGDIRELCELVHPTVGIITTVGSAHLERFGSVEAIARAKGELAESLPPDGLFITRADNAYCREIAARVSCRVLLFCPEPHPDADVWATGAGLRRGRTEFTLHVKDETAPVRAKLLGDHNIANLLAAAAFGVSQELELPAVARALGTIDAPEHRLSSIVNSAAGIVVIDDAYNSNPEGAAAALQVLGEHEAERRILITPGMVELGEQEEPENRAFGERAAAVCDLVLLVGERRTRPIYEGLVAGGFSEDAIQVVPDQQAVSAFLAQNSRRGDVILFENDLPDLYTETGHGGA